MASRDPEVTDVQIRQTAHELEGTRWQGILETCFQMSHRSIVGNLQQNPHKDQEDVICDLLHKWKENTGLVTARDLYEKLHKAYQTYKDIPIIALRSVLLPNGGELNVN